MHHQNEQQLVEMMKKEDNQLGLAIFKAVSIRSTLKFNI